MPLFWTFRSYRSANGKCVVRRWCRESGPKVEAAFDTVRKFLEQRELNDWERPEFAPLSGKHSGLHEIRFKAGGVQRRIFGILGSSGKDFTMLMPCSKKNPNYDPRDALDTALRRKKEVETDPTRAATYVNTDDNDDDQSDPSIDK